MEWLKNALEHLKPDVLIETLASFGIWGLVFLLLIIFAETGLFFGFFFPGDSLLFAAGLSVKVGILPVNLFVLILLVYAAAVLGNFVGYYFGWYMGPRLFKRNDSLFFKKKHLDMTQSFYDRYGKMALILGRFLPIVRTFVPILAGAIKLDFKKFTLYNLAGAALWVPTLIIVGYWLGHYQWVRENLEKIVIGLIIITIIPVIRTYIVERRRHAKEKAAAPTNVKIEDEAEV
jgi:membrane-associated protein